MRDQSGTNDQENNWGGGGYKQEGKYLYFIV